MCYPLSCSTERGKWLTSLLFFSYFLIYTLNNGDNWNFFFFCSIGGADYGSVRVGAFMGQKMIKSGACALLTQSSSSANGNTEELEEGAVELLQTEASLDYLCNLSPHRSKC